MASPPVLATVPVARRDSSSACFTSGVLLTRRLVFACRLNGPWTLTGPLTHTHSHTSRYLGRQASAAKPSSTRHTKQSIAHYGRTCDLLRPRMYVEKWPLNMPRRRYAACGRGRGRGPTGGDSNHGEFGPALGSVRARCTQHVSPYKATANARTTGK
jgi:hypothetical protein